MTTILFALALLGPAHAADHDAALHGELLALGLPTDLSPSPPLPDAAALPGRKGRASRGHSGSRGGLRGGSHGGLRGSSRGGLRGGSRPSSSRPSSARSTSSGSRKPASARPGSSSRPSGSRKPVGGSPPSSRPSSRPPTSQPSGGRPTTSPSSRPPRSGQPLDRRPPSGAGHSAPTTARTRPGASGGHPTRNLPTSRTVPGRTVTRPTPRTIPTTRPGGTLRSPTTSRPSGRPIYRTHDVRYARPSPRAVRVYPRAHYHVPRVYTYRPYYTRWWCHPYYRYSYATVAVVGFGFPVYAWNAYWVPPYRPGWTWVPGYWAWGYWNPGYWAPLTPAPVNYVYVNGWWEGDAYVEGYYRAEARDGWEWIDGYYLDDGTYVRGTWVPTSDPPEGYLWEPGFWDGETYIDGFYRPQFRKGFYWVAAWYDSDGIFHSGYWQPEEERPGFVWIPGWFDGNEWVPGYWEDEQTYLDTDVESWTPPEGLEDGWEEGEVYDEDGHIVLDDDGPSDAPPTAKLVQRLTEVEGEPPLAVPVVIPDDAE